MNKDEVLQLGYEKLFRKHPFEAWVTIGFKKETLMPVAQKMLKCFFTHLNNGAVEFYQKYVLMWVFYEQDRNRDGVHIHALVQGLNQSQFRLLERKGCAYFGNTKIEPPHDGVIPYVAKKCWSPDSKLEDWDFLRINSKNRKPRDERNTNSMIDSGRIAHVWRVA